MKKLPDIALCAKMRAGKDEFYQIASELGYNVRRVAFGDTMKEDFHQLFPHIPVSPKPIELYQKFGQSLREIDEDIFIRKTIGAVLQHKSQLGIYGIDLPSYIYTDVRQPNEYEAVKKQGCILIRVNALNSVRIERMKTNGEEVTPQVLTADTEKHVDNFKVDFELSNNGTREEFKTQIKNLLWRLGK